jgi:hypothetical protein
MPSADQKETDQRALQPPEIVFLSSVPDSYDRYFLGLSEPDTDPLLLV